MQPVEQIVYAALEGGGDRAVNIDASQVILDEKVRLKCRIPVCNGYGHSLTCPPNTPTVEEFKKILSLYSEAILVHVKAKGNSEEETTTAELQVQKLMGDLEIKALRAGHNFAAGFAAGPCRFCQECVGIKSGQRCRHPFHARPSTTAVGINIYKTSENAGIPLRPLDREHLYLAGLLLLS